VEAQRQCLRDTPRSNSPVSRKRTSLVNQSSQRRVGPLQHQSDVRKLRRKAGGTAEVSFVPMWMEEFLFNMALRTGKRSFGTTKMRRYVMKANISTDIFFWKQGPLLPRLLDIQVVKCTRRCSKPVEGSRVP